MSTSKKTWFQNCALVICQPPKKNGGKPQELGTVGKCSERKEIKHNGGSVGATQELIKVFPYQNHPLNSMTIVLN